MRCRAWLLPATLLQGIFASSEVDMDPLSNLRPTNITGLVYYLYRWTGSYYNGSTTIKLQPQDFIQDKCDAFAPGPIVISYNTSLLAVTPTNGYLVKENYAAANPLAFSLKFWKAGLNILPSGNMNDGPTKEIQEISSVQMNNKDKPSNLTASPPWNLTASHDEAVSYSFTGYRNATGSPQPLRFNYTQCESPSLTLYNGTLLEAHSSFPPNITITTEPRVSGTFNNGSASLEITGVYQGKTSSGSFLGGNITILFNGTIDEVRSDRIVSNTHGSTPVWESTLGFEKTLTGEVTAPLLHLGIGQRLGFSLEWLLVLVGLVVIVGL